MKTPILEPVGVLGVGVEGRSTINYLLRHGIKDITALDLNPVDTLPKGIKSIFGTKHNQDLGVYRTIFRSPGIRPDIPPLEEARHRGSTVTSAIAHFLSVCNAKVVGITGTVGKGTAASLTAKMLENAGYTVYLGGNIGLSPLDFLDQVCTDDRVVLEISSFQAMDLATSPHVAVALKTTSEHLDWHRDIDEYHAAKSQLFVHQKDNDIVIFNSDVPASKKIAASTAKNRLEYSLKSRIEHGVYVEDNQFWYANGSEAPICLPLDTSKIKLPGIFNQENIAASLLAALALGASTEASCSAAEAFEGLPHRLEFVAHKKGVKYFNDSYATRPEATLGALECFKDIPLALILGGSEKHADFDALAAAVQSHPSLIQVALIGDTAPRLEKSILQRGRPPFALSTFENLESATQAVSQSFSSKGVVLMSPACASFGLFKNYKIRGERFREIVLSLP